METHKTILIDPADLQVHPLAKNLPQWADDDSRFEALVEDIRARGIDQPLIITPEKQILDGRHRWRSAKRLQLAQVPVCVQGNGDIAGVIIGTLLQRRHFSRSALAYLAYPLFKSAHEEAIRKEGQNLKKGLNSPLPTQCETAADLAEQIGVSRALFDQAAQVHKLFAKDPAYKALMEPRILAPFTGGEHEDKRPTGLGAVLAGYAGQGNKGKPRRARHDETIFQERLHGFILRATSIEKPSEVRPIIIAEIKTIKTPEELERVMAFADEIHDAAKDRSRKLARDA